MLFRVCSLKMSFHKNYKISMKHVIIQKINHGLVLIYFYTFACCCPYRSNFTTNPNCFTMNYKFAFKQK